MRSRQDLTELFSTFVQFDAEYFSSWATDARLRRSMQNCLQRFPDAPNLESFWALYWYKILLDLRTLPGNLAGFHLSAYLQEPCYWAAQQIAKKFTTVQYRLPDYFQMAIAEVSTVLHRFDPDRGASLKTYAGMVFTSILRDALRQRQAVDLCTNWTLLRKISKKRLGEALQAAGVSAASIASYRLAWTCFKALYVPTSPTEPLSSPDSRLWEAVAQLYNAERLSALSGSSSKAIGADTIEKWLTQCATWVRAYLYPAIASLNAPQINQKSGQEIGEVQDQITAVSESLLTEMIAQEETQTRQTQQTQIQTVLSTALKQLDTPSQELMRLYYSQGLTQQQIVQHLQLSQATVSRRLNKVREALLTAMVQWSQKELNIVLTPTLIKEMSTALEAWLSDRDPTSGFNTGFAAGFGSVVAVEGDVEGNVEGEGK
jgi:RNA polymerase sigma factor (sigma-70 family)